MMMKLLLFFFFFIKKSRYSYFISLFAEIPLQRPSEEIGNSFLLHQSNSVPEFQHQFEEIPTAPVAVNETINQQQQQGYFTSILSSLPNLSLSSIRDQPLPQRPPSHPAIFDPSESPSTIIQNSTVNSTPQHFPSTQFPPVISNDPSRPIAPPTVALPPPSAVPPVTGKPNIPATFTYFK